jgi:hypothetical protein
MCRSYATLLGAAPAAHAAAGEDAGRWLYEDAPFAALAQDTCADPLFVYAN